MKWFFNKFLGVWNFLFFWFFFLFFNFCFFLLFFMLFFFFLFSFCKFWNSYLSLFFLAGFFFPFFWLFKYFFGVLNLNYFFCFCFCFVCWAIVRTKTNATCKWDHLWNDELWIKLTFMPTFFQGAHSIKHSNMECGVSSPYNDQIKKGWEFCQFNLAPMQRALEIFRIAKIGQDLHPERSVKWRSFDLWITMNWKRFMADKFHHIQFSLQICIVCLTCVSKIILIGLCVCPL
jgi:hypothetical protein